MDLGSSFLPLKKAKFDTDFSVCLICQKTGKFVGNPTTKSYETILSFIRDRAGFGEADIIAVDFRLTNETAETLEANNASWHRECYDIMCHKQKRDAARRRYEKALFLEDSTVLRRSVGRPEKMVQVPDVAQALPTPAKLTRSSIEPLDRQLCLFCQTIKPQVLRVLTSQKSAIRLQKAIEQESNEALRLKLNSGINSDDIAATCLKYHDHCWRSNVDRVLTKTQEISKEQINDVPSISDSTESSCGVSNICNTPLEDSMAIVAADMEFMSLLELLLQEGSVLSMADLHKKYVDIRKANGVTIPECKRPHLKQKIANHIRDVHFGKPKRPNESEYVYTTRTRDEVIQTAAKACQDDMKTIYEASQILRKAISLHLANDQWKFSGSLADTNISDTYPEYLHHFLRWLLLGPQSSLNGNENENECAVEKGVHSAAQSIMYAYKTKRQVSTLNRSSSEKSIRHVNEWPLQLAVGLSVHQATRSRSLLEILNGFGVSVDYFRILRLETQIAEEICNQVAIDGIYIPPFVQQGRFVFFAIDNSDFNEDTPDGKRTTHATATVVYQQAFPGDEDRKFVLQLPRCQNTSLQKWNEPVIQQCHIPANSKPNVEPMLEARVESNETVLEIPKQTDMSWLLARSFERNNRESDNKPSVGETVGQSSSVDDCFQIPTDVFETESGNSVEISTVPTWSAFNSCLSEMKPKTKCGPLPLLYAPAHEWSTLVTVLKQAQHISCKTTGANSKAVITLDMQLYEKAKKLQLYQDDCKGKWVLRVGELHTVMAALRTIGSAIEGSGLDDCWVESDLYGPATVRQILECGHMKRSLTAHVVTLQALFDLYKEEFFKQNPELEVKYSMVMNEFKTADLTAKETVRKLHNRIQVLLNKEIDSGLDKFHDENQNPMFRFMTMYMNMIFVLLSFIRATRDGLWELHLASLEHFARFFFAFDKLKYARMIPVYIADMKKLKNSDSEIWNEFQRGNFVVNKSEVPFCAIGPDHGIEQVNRSMKVSGGLVGITLNESARSRFFLVAPELSRLAQEAKSLVNIKKETAVQHHESSPAFARNQNDRVMKLKKAIDIHTNPFHADGDDLFTLVTKTVMPEKVTQDLTNADQIGLSKHTSFVERRIASNTENIWAPMKKTNLSVWKSVNKKTKMKVADQVVELKSERSLFARLVVVAKSRPDVDIKEAIGKFEFTTYPRSLFDGSGKLLPAGNKSQLMGIIETYSDTQAETKETKSEHEQKTCVIDGMALVQEMGKPLWVNSCEDLADHFLERLENKTKHYSEIHLIFDRYDVVMSLKAATRERRQGSVDKISYQITDTTVIKTIPMKKLLSHSKTKDKLCEYLAHKTIQKFAVSETVFVVAYNTIVLSNKPGFENLSSSQEEADTKIILHASHAARNGSAAIDIISPDTDVFILALRRVPDLAPNTSFVTGTGSNKRSISLNSIHTALGSSVTSALPGFHAFSGCDQTGKFAGKGKSVFWKTLMNANEETLQAFSSLGASETISEETVQRLEQFVCKLYAPNMNIENLCQLRWKLFSKRQAEAEKLPPTLESLRQAILRAHYQALIWQNDIVPNPTIPSPENYGWRKDNGTYVPLSSELPAAPDAVVQLVRCSCSKSKCSSSCSCRRNNMNCTEMCECEGDLDVCRNVYVLNTDFVFEELDSFLI